MISVIIATRNRPDKLKRCLLSIIKSSFRGFEILVLDQSDNVQASINAINTSKFKVRYHKLDLIGKSKALNFGIRLVKNNILAFTDDDCVVDKNWLMNVDKILNKNKEISGLLGRSLPYGKSQFGMICVSCQENKNTILFDTIPQKRFDFLGNCMALRKDALIKIGMFKEWLGNGSIGRAAEDEEVVYRLLANKHKILYDPRVVVYHDHWISINAYQPLMNKYSAGYFAAFTFHLFNNFKVSSTYLVLFLKAWLREWTEAFTNNIKSFNLRGVSRSVYNLSAFLFFLKGVLIGVFFALREKSGK